jgi:hypothetical protein
VKERISATTRPIRTSAPAGVKVVSRSSCRA